MAIRMIDHGTEDYNKMVELRTLVLRKPLGLSFDPAELAKEKNEILIGCFDEETMEGCCMLVRTDRETIRLRQMAVLYGLQGKGIGRTVMQFAENFARDMGYRKMEMHARKTAVGFYEKLGYQVTGDEFEEVTLPHYKMIKQLC
jgi:GNAT superfamily N-acetyltransferase